MGMRINFFEKATGCCPHMIINQADASNKRINKKQQDKKVERRTPPIRKQYKHRDWFCHCTQRCATKRIERFDD